MTVVKSLMVQGAFTEPDLAELMTVFRQIERRQPNEPFLVAILESDLSITQAQGIIRRTFPRIGGDEPTVQTIHAIQVLCPDGEVRPMIPDIPNLVVDIDQPAVLMMQGTVEINDQPIRGEAWRKDGSYHFTPFP